MRLAEPLGAVAVVAGFVVLSDRSVAALLALDESLLLLLAVLAAVLGIGAVRDRRDADPEAADTADVERRYEAPRPGAEFDDRLAGAAGFSRPSQRRQAELRDRVADAAAGALTAVGVDDDAAADLIGDGEWTEDRLAAWFLSPGLELPLRTKLQTLRSGSRFQFAADRAIDAVGTLQRGDGDPPAEWTRSRERADGGRRGSGGADRSPDAPEPEDSPETAEGERSDRRSGERADGRDRDAGGSSA